MKSLINDDDAQNTVDFTIALILFLVGIILVLNNIANITVPFSQDSNEASMISDKTSQYIIDNLEVKSKESTNTLSVQKTKDYFSTIDNNYTSEREKLGLISENIDYELNVTITKNDSTLYSAGKSVPENVDGNSKYVNINYNNSSKIIASLNTYTW